MKVLELFSGTRSISKEFEAKGHKCYTIDNNEYFRDTTSLIIDILKVTPEMIIKEFGKPDIIWASPPCTAFSVASIGCHWTGGKNAYVPKTEFAELSKKIVIHTIELIKALKPKFWFIENPRGVLRKMPFMQELPRYTVTYCQYGDTRMKPTDIWTNHRYPRFKPMCHNGDHCHVSAPRGSKTGTQGLKNNIIRSIIPQELCKHIVDISEEPLNKYERKEQLKLF